MFFHHVDKQIFIVFCVMDGGIHARNIRISLTLSQYPWYLVKVNMKMEPETEGGRGEDRLN